MAFTARYAGRCPTCHDDIEPGDRLEYVDVAGVDVAMHVDCQDPRAGVPAAGHRRIPSAAELPARPVCPTCHLVVPCWCE